jgi:hypothetical protein
MGMIQVRVQDISGSRVCDVEAPDDIAINRILALLVERMNLPLNSPDGQIMSYKLHHRRTGQQLLDKQTLLEAGVQARDELRLQPEITAGLHGPSAWGFADHEAHRFASVDHGAQSFASAKPQAARHPHGEWL